MDELAEFLKLIGLDPYKQYGLKELKNAWKKKCKEHHPDTGGDPSMFRTITHAYKMITDEAYRNSMKRLEDKPVDKLHIRMQVPVAFEDAFFGKTITFSYNRVVILPTGEPVVKDHVDIVTVNIPIPPGSCGGHNHFEAGKGLECNGAFGDLTVVIIPKNHNKFRVQGMNTTCVEDIPLDIMLKGGEVEAYTMYGIKSVLVPPGTMPDAQLIIPNCGVNEEGDHIIVVKAVFPNAKKLREKEWEGLKVNWELKKEDTEEVNYNNVFDRLRNSYTSTGGF